MSEASTHSMQQVYLRLKLCLQLPKLTFQAFDGQVLILETLGLNLEIGQIMTNPGIAAFQLGNLAFVFLHICEVHKQQHHIQS